MLKNLSKATFKNRKQMKTKIFLLSMALACTAGSALTGSSCSGSTPKKSGAGELVLDLYDTSHGVVWYDTVTGNPGVSQGGYWSKTYDETATSLQFGDFVLTHEAGWGGSFWAGFTIGANGDPDCYAIPCPSGGCDSTHSEPWVDNQWGVKAGGGIVNTATTPPTVQKGVPYLIAYWNYYADSHENRRSLEVKLADDALFAPQEVYIGNHPWPFCGNIYGDGFARPFKKGDHFDLWIHAVKDDGREDSILFTLAEFPNRVLIQSPNWTKVNLASLGSDVKSLYFTMYSTDEYPPYGPNTAAYFNMDKLKVVKQDAKATPAPALRAKAAKPVVEVTDYFPLPSYTGGEVVAYDANSREVLKTTVKAGEKINLSKLPAGEYRLRHGHKVIPIKKVK
jgi:hypothetical protein